MRMSYSPNCRYFLGDQPCKFKRTCPKCPQHNPMGQRILIVKLAAIGDVMRTTPILSGLKRVYPYSHITWVVDKEAYPLLKNNPYIDRLLIFDFLSLLPLELETFDLIIGLEKDPRGATLVSKLKAHVKKGFGYGSEGNIYPINKTSEYAFILGLDDELKYHQNQKTYPELIFEMAELDYKKDEYQLFLSQKDYDFAETFAEIQGLKEQGVIIGLNTGAGSGFVNKAWIVEGYLQLIAKLKDRPKTRLLLLGGPNEKKLNIKFWYERSIREIIDSGCENTLGQFAALINLCDVIVTGDTAALHIAIALKKKVVAIFGPSCPQEVELYGRGEKVVTSIPCAPCSRRECEISPNCMQIVKVDEVINALQKLI